MLQRAAERSTRAIRFQQVSATDMRGVMNVSTRTESGHHCTGTVTIDINTEGAVTTTLRHGTASFSETCQSLSHFHPDVVMANLDIALCSGRF